MPEKPSKKPIIDMPSKKQIDKVVNKPYSQEELSSKKVEKRIQQLMDFFDQYGIDYEKFVSKRAYPNNDQQYMHIPNRHDMRKWMLALKDIHYKQRGGLGYKEAIKLSTSGWPKMEIYDFLNWMKFYDEGAQMKYKFAQVWYENGQPGYFLHVKPDPAPVADPIIDANAVNDAREEAEKKEERKQTIEKQRQKIIGRLDSAEKLLRSPEGQMFAGDELENLMEAIYGLKKKVQLVNKISVSTRLYEDMIVREANVLNRKGFVKAAEVLYSVAQTPGAIGETAQGGTGDTTLTASPPPDPSGAGQSGTMSGLPATAPGTPSVQTPVDGDQNTDTPPIDKLNPPANQGATTVSSPAIMPQEDPQPKGIKEFIENMNQGNKTEDDIEVSDTDDELMVSEAQAAPGVPPAALEDVPMTSTPAPERNPPTFVPDAAPESPDAPKPEKTKAPDAEEPLEVTENDIPSASGVSLENKVNEVFANMTIADIVAELEDISKSYKTRDQARRLGFVDMALDSKGLASFFPSLAEAQNKALEANNYISTRVDDILAKLRGALASQENEPTITPESPELTGVKSKLQTDMDKEKQRKQMRKDQETAALEGTKKETPEVEMGELGAPPAPPAVPPTPRPLG